MRTYSLQSELSFCLGGGHGVEELGGDYRRGGRTCSGNLAGHPSSTGGLPSVAGLSSKAVFSGIFNLCVVALLTMGVLKLGDLAQLDASVRSLEAASRPQITPENVETHIRSWLDTFELSAKKVQGPAFIFGYEVGPQSLPVLVVREKRFERYITIQAVLRVSPEHQAMMTKLTKEQQDQLVGAIILETARAGAGVVYDRKDNTIAVSKRVPITGGLTEYEFVSRLDAVKLATLVANETLVSKLDRMSMSGTAPRLPR
jgi:hypothetical protein